MHSCQVVLQRQRRILISVEDVRELSRVLHELYNARSGTPPSLHERRKEGIEGGGNEWLFICAVDPFVMS